MKPTSESLSPSETWNRRDTEAEALAALAEVEAWMAEAGLTLHPEKTRVVDATRQGGFEFLGWHFERGMKWPRRNSIQKLKDSVRARTKRNNGHDMCTIIKRVNQITRGWGNYFRGGVQKVAQKSRPMDKDASSQHPAKAGQTQGPGPRSGSQPVSKCLVR